MIGGLRFYERQEIRDAVAYIRAVMRPDDDLAFERIVNLPKRGLGEASLRPVHRAFARADGVSLYRAVERLIETDELKPRARSALAGLIGRLRGWRAALAETPHAEVVGTMLDESGYTEMWQKDRSPAAPGRLENLKELVEALSEFEDLAAFLDHVSLVMDREGDGAEEMVNIMTLHGAKGPRVRHGVPAGLGGRVVPPSAGARPIGRSRAGGGTPPRLCRAHRAPAAAPMSFSRPTGTGTGQWVSAIPSRFVDELAPDHVMLSEGTGMQPAPGGLYRGHGGAAAARRLMSEHAAYRSRRVPPVIDAAPLPVTSGAGPGGYAAGERVFHQKFGYGKIRAVDGDKLEVAFDKAGIKKIIDRFVQPADSV